MISQTTATVQTHYLYPSTLFANRELVHVITVLGSCIAVCLHDPYLSIGGINHYMLPLWNGQGLASPKFGNIAIEKLLSKMYSLGCRRENLVAKIFGGAMLLQSEGSVINIGARNIEIARDILSEQNIPIVTSNTGGNKGRKIIFNTKNGEVRHKLI